MATQTQYYNLDKPSYDEVADIEIINANMDKIDQQMRNNADGVNFAKGISSDAYDNSKLYAVGDYCIYDNKLYRCVTAIESAEAFNIAKWEQTTVGNEVNQLNSNLEQLEYSDVAGGKNLYNRSKEENGYINSQGVDTESNDWRRSYFIPITSGKPYTITVNSNRSSLVFHEWCDDNKSFVSNIPSGNAVNVVSPQNAKYLRISYNKTSTNVQVEQNTQATPYEPYIPSVEMLSDEVKAQNDSLGEYDINENAKDSYSGTGFALNWTKLCHATKGTYKLSYTISNSTNSSSEIGLGKYEGDKSLYRNVVNFKNGVYEGIIEITSDTDIYMFAYTNGSFTISNIKFTLQNIANEVGNLKNDLTKKVYSKKANSSLDMIVEYFDISFTNGNASIDLTDYIPSGKTLVTTMAFAQFRADERNVISGVHISNNTLNLLLSDTSANVSNYVSVMFFVK